MKKFTCVCGSKEFRMNESRVTVVDFSKEGSIKGHPFLIGKGTHFVSIHCAECGAQVPESVVELMRKEII